MNPDRHRRAMQLFHDALEQGDARRGVFLRDACGDDRELREEVESLLAHHDTQTIIIDRAAPGRSSLPPAEGQRTPRARLLPQLWTQADRGGLRITLAVLALALTVLGLGYWLEAGVERRLRDNLSGQLQATLSSNVAAVENWLELQKAELEKWASHPDVRAQFPTVVALAQAPAAALDELRGSEPYREIMETISPLVERSDVRTVNGVDIAGMIVLSSSDRIDDLRRVSVEGAKLLAPVLLGQTVMSPPLLGHSLVEGETAESNDEPILLVGSPVRDGGQLVVGGLFASIESGRDFTMLLDLGRAGLRSDTYAFGPTGRLLSASRYESQLKQLGLIDDSAGSSSVLQVVLRDPGVDLTTRRASGVPRDQQPLTAMAASAVTGADGINLAGYRDYRGVPVVGAWNWLEQYGFGIATEIEYDEAYSSLHYVRRSFWVLVSVLTVCAVAAFVFALSAARLRREVGEARQLGQYTLDELIGEGGMGKVYRASHALLRRPTAVKVLDGARADRLAIARFEREVQIASSLNHPNTVEIYDYGRTADDVFYFAMEYLPGVTLEGLVRSEGAVPAARVLHILRQVLGSLSEAHERGLIHRDIKPANVILCQRGGVSDFVKVVDFGLAKDPSFDSAPEITQPGLISGTPMYIAPECLDDPTSLSARSDIYAVGAVAFYLLTGRELFVAANTLEIFRCVMSEPPPRPSDVLPDGIPAELDSLVHLCVAKDPGDRPGSAREILAIVSSIAADHVWSNEDADRWWRRYGERQARFGPTSATV